MSKGLFKVTLFCIALLCGSSGFGQAGDYAFTVSTSTYVPLGGTATSVPNAVGDTESDDIPIGFNFDFEGVSYDSVSVASDGFISFVVGASSDWTNDLDNGSAARKPLVAPLWDDMDGRSISSDVLYEVSGVAPNRVLTVEWVDVGWPYSFSAGSDSVVSFQTRLYETSNVIEFTYQWECYTCFTSGSASIGLSGASSFLSVTGVGTATPTASSTLEDSGIDTVVSGQVFTFTPPACPTPVFGTVSSVTTSVATISFTSSGSGPYYINYDMAGFTQGAAGSDYDTVASSPFILQGLQDGETYDFYIQEDCGANGQSNWVGANSFTTIANCIAPTALADSNITTGSIDIGWQSGGSGPWYIYWGPCGFDQATPGVSVDTATTTTYALSGLSPNTSYQYYLVEGCGTDVSDSVDGGCFNTLCLKQSLPYSENFDYGLGCFSIADSGTSNDTWMQVQSYNGSDFDGTGFMFVNSDAAGSVDMEEYLTSPAIDASGITGQLVLEFDQYFEVWSSEDADVEVWDGTQWVTVLAQTGSTIGSFASPNHQSINLTSYANDSLQVRFHYYDANYEYYWAIDNFEVMEVQCLPSTMLSAYSIGADSIAINWVPGDGSTYGIEYGPAGFTPGSGSMTMSVTDTFAVISGLSSLTVYDIYVYDSCATGTSVALGPISVSTSCPVQSLPFSESFSTDLGCFIVSQNGGNSTDTWAWMSDYTDFSGTHTVDGSTGFAMVNSDAAGPAASMDEILVSPPIDASSVTGALVLEFDQFYQALGDTAAVDVWDGNQWVNIIKQTATVGSWGTPNHQFFDVTAYANAAFQVRFHYYNANYAWYWSIDNFSLSTLPCGIAANLDTGLVTPTSAELKWSSNGSLWNIEWGPAGFQQGSGTGTIIRGVGSNPYTLGGLGPDSCYSYYVQDTCASIGTGTWVGPFIFCTPPTCPEPTNLGTDPGQVTLTSAGIYWNSGGSGNWNIEYGPAGFTPGSGNRIQSTNDTLVLTGLTTGTAYDFYVRDSCSATDTSAWTGPSSFITAFSTNYLQDFNSTPFFAWSEATGRLLSNTTFTSNTVSAWGSQLFGNTGSPSNRINLWTSNQFEWSISPSIYLDPTITNLQVEFDVSISQFNSATQGYLDGSDDTLAVVISTDNGATWSNTNIIWYTDENDTIDVSGEHVTIPLTGYSGYVKFGLYGGSVTDDLPDNDLYIDNFEVRTPRACVSPSAITISNIKTDSATVDWTAGTPGFVGATVIYTLGNQPASAGTAVSATTKPVILSGLTSSTGYCVYVVEQCANGYSDTIGPICFTSQCTAVMAPYFQDFESFTVGHFDGSEGCWDFYSNSPGTTPSGNFSWEVRNSVQTTSTNTGPNGDHTLYPAIGGKWIHADNSGGAANDSTMFISPVVDISGLTNPELQYWFHNYAAPTSIYRQPLYVDLFDGTTWYYKVHVIDSVFQSSGTDPWQDTTLNLAPYSSTGTIQVRFRSQITRSAGGAGDVAIDDVRIANGTSCASPTGVSATVQGCDTVDVSWSSASAATNSYIEYGAKGFTPGSGTVIANVSSPYQLTGLALNTEYDLFVVDSCGMDQSNPSARVSFKTDSVGPVMASFTYTQISTTLTDADVDFDASASTGDGLSYSWDFDGSTGNGVSPQANYTGNGTYNVTLTVTDRCGNTDDTTVAITIVGISIVENEYNASLELYPNPNNGTFKVNVSEGSEFYSLEVVDLSGKVVYQRENLKPGEVHEVNLGNVADGVYMIRFRGEGLSATQRIVVE